MCSHYDGHEAAFKSYGRYGDGVGQYVSEIAAAKTAESGVVGSILRK